MRCRWGSWVVIWLLSVHCVAVALPSVLEAERAEREENAVIVPHPNASGGAFVETQTTTTLRFTIHASRPMRVRLIPIFWRNSARFQPRFFPQPLPTFFGPDTVVAIGDRIYFTAPASGRIGILNAQTGELFDSIEVGGYLTDMIADAQRQRLLVADAWNGRILVIDTDVNRIVAQAKVPQVWSLDESDGKFFAVSRNQNQLFIFDASTLKPLKTIPLPSTPIHVAAKTNNIVVRFKPFVLRLTDFSPMDADQLDYGFGLRTNAEFGPRNQVGWKRFAITPKGLQLTVRTEKGDESRPIFLPQNALPLALSVSGKRLLIATERGSLVILDMAAETPVANLQVTDRSFDVAVVAGKAYANDPTQNRILVVDIDKGQIVKSFSVPDEPVALETYEPRWWTQDEAPQPLLFVACRRAKNLVVISPKGDKVLRIVKLPFEPASLRVVLPPNPDWWPLIPADRTAIELTPRLAVAPSPLTLDTNMLSEVPLPSPPPFAIQRRNFVTVKLPDGRQVTVIADNNHTLRYRVVQKDGKSVSERWIDTSAITDRQGVAPVVDFGALKIADRPWNCGIWMTPDQQLLLVADTDEFWQWNAPVINLRKGSNLIPVTLQKFVQLDAMRVEPIPPLSLRIVGETTANLPERYRAVFYADEPIRLRLILQLTRPSPYKVRLVVRIRNYMGEEVWVRVLDGAGSTGQGKRSKEWVIEPKLRETGIFKIEAKLETPDGAIRRNFYFLRLPKLERPRLLTRKAQLELAKAQIAKNPNLFARYFAWLKEHLSEPSMLPVSLLTAEFTAALPSEQQKLSRQGGWRRYDFAWRLIALQFAAMMLPEQEAQDLRRKVFQVLKSGKTDYYCHFHHHGPFFPGFVAAFLDLVASDIGENAEEVQKLREFLATRLGDMNVFAWTLAAMGDPPSERERILLWHMMTWTINAERYFTVHAGRRGGTWWLNQRTACHCPFGAYAFAFFYLRHFYGEDRYHYRKFVRGFLTHARLSRPLNDIRGLFGPPGPPGEPQRWLTFALSRHPLTEAIYGWRNLVQRLNNDEPAGWNGLKGDLAKILTFPTSSGNNSPVPFVLPIGLALGWYDPEAPQVNFNELPTTLFFDGEGEVVMRSDYGQEATEVFFACGIRDHVYRHQPTNLMVLKAGEPLLGTASLWGDHGCPSLQISRGNSWGNVVVIEPSDWQTRWKHNLFHLRGEEQAIINRFSDATFRYLVRDQRLAGYIPAEGGYGGGLNLHGHTQTFLHREGHIVAFETHPAFDYVAGDATLSWQPELARLVLRQVVFVKPDLLIVYDRVRLGDKAQRAYWLATTGLELQTNGNRFFVRSGNAFLNGFVAFPNSPKLVAIDPSQSQKYQPLFDKQALGLKVLEIHGRDEKRWVRDGLVEFLVLMKVGTEELPAMTVKPKVTAQKMGVTVMANGQTVHVSFNRGDLCSGEIAISNGKEVLRHQLREKVKDTHENWRTDPRYPRWREARFDFLDIAKPLYQ